MTAGPQELHKLLCEPGSLAPLTPSPGGFKSATGNFYPHAGGFPNLLPGSRTLRARFWEWVYNRTAFGYDFGVRFAWRLPLGGAPIRRQDYLSLLDFRPGAWLLETGTGTGDNLLAAPPDVHLFGIDQSIEMLRRCRQKLNDRARSAGLVQADLHAVPFRSGVFDIVLHMGGLQFTSAPRTAIADWFRVAAGGAQILIVEEAASIPSILRRARTGAVEDLLPGTARKTNIETISGGELLMIASIKA